MASSVDNSASSGANTLSRKDDAMLERDAAMLKVAYEYYKLLAKIKRLDYPRMLVKACSLYTWMLTWTCIIDGKFSVRLTKQKIKQGEEDGLGNPLME